MIKVLAAIVAPPHLNVSGAGRAAEQLSIALAQHCDITIASMMGAQIREAEQSEICRVPVTVGLPPFLPWRHVPNRYRTLFYGSDISEMVRSGSFDLVHLHNPMPALEMARIARACRGAGVPYVVSTHGFNEIAHGARIYGFGRLRRLVWQALVTRPVQQAVRGAAAVLGLSPADREIVDTMGFAGSFAVVPNGVPMPGPFDASEDSAICVRLGVPARRRGELTCMFLANHTPNKGLPVLLEAFDGLTCPYTLIVGGEKRAEIDYALASLTRRADQRIIVTGRLSDRQVQALFRRSDLFVFPTLADTFPLVVLEAMSHGVPVLASRVGGIPHQLDQACGQLVEPGNVRQLRDAVSVFAHRPEMLLQMGQRAKNRVARHFTWENAAKRAFAEYEQALAAPSRAPATALPAFSASHALQRGTRA
ncbi:glycosyltransferase family 4 protein [Bosea sp. (in: a-proteobacteria)]|uniref:glycosyltransferase family 4 protein n=1 Tax=Bosea sp. (in: a-proteobacteria) TaxID=1871050 RepID=UPI002FCC392D